MVVVAAVCGAIVVDGVITVTVMLPQLLRLCRFQFLLSAALLLAMSLLPLQLQLLLGLLQ